MDGRTIKKSSIETKIQHHTMEGRSPWEVGGKDWWWTRGKREEALLNAIEGLPFKVVAAAVLSPLGPRAQGGAAREEREPEVVTLNGNYRW
jgi:hypothetical protein